MKKCVLILLCFIVASFNLYAAADSTKVGFYISDIYDLNSANGTFSAEIRNWVILNSDSVKTTYTEFPHTKNYKFTGHQKKQINGVTWIVMHISAQFIHNWDMTNFPFDRQKLRIINECTLDTTENIIYADTINSKVVANAIDTNFRIIDYRIYDTVKVNYSTFGNPIIDSAYNTCYSRVIAEIEIERVGTWVIFFKIFAAVIISFYISTLVFLIKPQHFEARFSLPIGALFAAVGSKFVVDSLLGITSTITLVDKVYIFTYIMVFVIAVLSLVSYKVYENVDSDKIVSIHNRKFDLLSMILTCSLYFVIIVFMVVRASIY